MGWFAAIDLYCERTAVGFWNEPINALSNASFLLAALWGAYAARQHGLRNPLVVVLIILAALIGVGSFLFHTFANSWSELADVVPIWSFVALYVLSAVHLIGGVAPRKLLVIGVSIGAIVTLVMLAMTGDTPEVDPAPFNGSLQYAPALIALCVFAFVTWKRAHPLRPWAVGAAVVFALSLVFRTIDLSFCAAIPLGTHFLWHLLNGLMVALLLQALIRHSQKADLACIKRL